MLIALTKICLLMCLYHDSQLQVKADMCNTLLEILQRWGLFRLQAEGTYVLNTPGCAIPNILTIYPKIEEANDCLRSCGTRAVYIATAVNDNVIKFIIDEKAINKIFGNNTYECCSQFAYRIPGDKLEYTQCIPFKNGSVTGLEHEVVKVSCSPMQNSTNYRSYEDAYIVIKKLKTKTKEVDKLSFNILILGMDTMSRARTYQSMPKLYKYFKQNGWLDYRGFQKAASKSFPNIMNLMTGTKPDTYNNACTENVERFNDLWIWSEFKKSGYVTAYGEDGLPDTFEACNKLKLPPTDHYNRPILLLDQYVRGNIRCTEYIPNAHHLLSYADQFAKAYKNEKFFGFFWMASYSHDQNHLPTPLQDRLIRFFEKLHKSGVLNRTIIIFISDHGIRWGRMKIPVASHYDDRLPMLFMWYPHSFRKRFQKEYKNLKLNQHRLTTHSDVYATLWNVLKLADNSVQIIPPESCPRCSSLFDEKSTNRRCEDINVSELWCSCHVVNEMDSTDVASRRIPEFVLSKINKGDKDYKVLRLHWYKNKYDKNDTKYYLIVIQVEGSNEQFEAIIKNIKSEYEVVEEVHTISATSTDDCVN